MCVCTHIHDLANYILMEGRTEACRCRNGNKMGVQIGDGENLEYKTCKTNTFKNLNSEIGCEG